VALRRAKIRFGEGFEKFEKAKIELKAKTRKRRGQNIGPKAAPLLSLALKPR
jgi:hypothetical protein